MIFTPTPVPGAFVLEPERIVDERGWFARTFSSDDFRHHGLTPGLVQCSTSFNHRRATLRGIHYQQPPHGECKLVRCTSGAVYDVIVDLRRDSATFLAWFGVELGAVDGRSLYVPEGVAHGFLTLAPNSEVFYQMSAAHEPSAARGLRWDDPLVGIRWPEKPVVMSDRDRLLPDYAP